MVWFLDDDYIRFELVRDNICKNLVMRKLGYILVLCFLGGFFFVYYYIYLYMMLFGLYLLYVVWIYKLFINLLFFYV